MRHLPTSKIICSAITHPVLIDPHSTAVPGSLFTFKGTDLLYISRNSSLVERVDSSGDFLQFLYYSGVPVAFQLNVPRATCLPINEPAIAA